MDESKYIRINRFLHRKRTKEGLAKAKQEGRHIGRPHSFTVDQIHDILTMLASGRSYRDVASNYGVTHTTIAKIKQEGLQRCESIDKQRNVEKTCLDPEQAEIILNLNHYGLRLKNILEKKHGVKLNDIDCYHLVKEMLNLEVEQIQNPFVYNSEPALYIEMTSHKILV